MTRKLSPPRRLSLTIPSPGAVGVSLAVAAIVIVTNPATLSSFAIFDGKPPTLLNGLKVLLEASARSVLVVSAALALSLLVIVAILSFLVDHVRCAQAVRTLFTGLSNLPILFLLPIWLIVAGNSNAASFGFLLFCFFYLLGFVIFSDRSGGAKIAERVVQGFGLRSWRRLFLTMEVVLASMQTSVFQVLVLGLPLALAAEMISNRGGLGYLASAAFQNGNFDQMGVTVAAYLIAFCVLWLLWSVALAAPTIARAVRGG